MLALVDVGIAVIGTLASALAVQTRARELIVALMGLPLLVPVVLAARARDGAAVQRRRCQPAAAALAGTARPL